MKIFRSIHLRTAFLAVVVSLLVQHPIAAAEDELDLFSPDRVVQIQVTMDANDWHALRISHRHRDSNPATFAQSPYEYYPASVTIDGREFQSVGIRKKGFIGSAISTRPSLKIKLNKYVKGQKTDGMDVLTFNNNNQDPTQAQQFLVYGFMNEAGAMAPRVGFARIIVNGEDLGVYSHVEGIRKPFFKRRFGTSDGDLYEGMGADIAGRASARIVHKWGKDDELLEMKRLAEVVQASGPLDTSKLGEILDLDLFFTLWTSEVLAGHWDGYAGHRNNWHLYLNPGSGQFQMIPWGADSAFRGLRVGGGVTMPKSVWASGQICQQLWQLQDMRARYQAEMQRLLDSVWNEQTLLSELDRILRLTKDYRTINEDDVAREADQIRDYLKRRRGEIQTELDGVVPDFPDRTRGATGGARPGTMNISGAFSATMGGPMARARGITNAVAAYGIGDAKLSYSMDGETHKPFTRFNARAGTAMGVRTGYPMVRIDASDEDGTHQWILTMTLDPHQVRPGKNVLESDLFTAWCVLSQGAPGSTGRQFNVFAVRGEVRLDEFSMEPGGTVSGSFEFQASAFRKNTTN